MDYGSRRRSCKSAHSDCAVTPGCTALALVAWSQIWPASFDEWVTARMRSRWRTWWVYRHPWTAICTLHGLSATLGERTLVPTSRSVTIGTTCDVVTVRILIGQSVADWQNKAPALGEAFHAQRLTIRSTKPAPGDRRPRIGGDALLACVGADLLVGGIGMDLDTTATSPTSLFPNEPLRTIAFAVLMAEVEVPPVQLIIDLRHGAWITM
jgi:hypothetical protein